MRCAPLFLIALMLSFLLLAGCSGSPSVSPPAYSAPAPAPPPAPPATVPNVSPNASAAPNASANATRAGENSTAANGLSNPGANASNASGISGSSVNAGTSGNSSFESSIVSHRIANIPGRYPKNAANFFGCLWMKPHKYRHSVNRFLPQGCCDPLTIC